MIAYRDFEPRNPGIFPKPSALKLAFDAALVLVNQWIEDEAIDVIGIESMDVGQDSHMLRMIRVWYRATDAKPTSSAES